MGMEGERRRRRYRLCLFRRLEGGGRGRGIRLRIGPENGVMRDGPRRFGVLVGHSVWWY
jgi:hypothetical protein